MRIAIIALDAVLAEIEESGITTIVCLGDVAGLGAQPREVIARLCALPCPALRLDGGRWTVDVHAAGPRPSAGTPEGAACRRSRPSAGRRTLLLVMQPTT